jgi:alanine dehydrogenase
MPGAVPRTSTIALTNVTIPYALQIANKGIHRALAENHALELGLNTAAGAITYSAVAEDLGFDYLPAGEALERV